MKSLIPAFMLAATGHAPKAPDNGEHQIRILAARFQHAIKHRDKAAYDPGNNPVAFIDSIVSRKSHSEEDFRNIRINRDRDSAAMSFDYSFRMNGAEVNRGMEHWLLVNTNEGWRIVSVVWSVR